MRASGLRCFQALLLFLLSWSLISCDKDKEIKSTPAKGSQPGIAFKEVAKIKGLDFNHDRGATGKYHLFETMGGGMAWLDGDGDGDYDLFLPQGQPLDDTFKFPRAGLNRYFRNDGGVFTDQTTSSGLGGSGYGLGATVGDVDNDGDSDLYVIRFGKNALYLNDGKGKFTQVLDSGLEGSAPFSGSAAFGDFDGDGWVDLFLTQYVEYDLRQAPKCQQAPAGGGQAVPIYCGPITFKGARDQIFLNNRDGTFRDFTEESGMVLGGGSSSKSLGVLLGDFDHDQDLDAYVACDTTPNLLYLNQGTAIFKEVALESGVAASGGGLYEGGMGIASGDIDFDQRLDFYVTNFADESNRLYRSLTPDIFEDASLRLGMVSGTKTMVGWGTGFVDADLDRDLDLYVANGHIYDNVGSWEERQKYEQRNLFFRADIQGGGENLSVKYSEVSASLGAEYRRPASYRGATDVDFDNDGDRDLCFIPLDQEIRLFENVSDRSGRHFLQILLVGEGRGGKDAVGARVELKTQGGTQMRWRTSGGGYLSQSDPRIHFGLGADQKVDSLKIYWLDGTVEEVTGVPVDSTIKVQKGRGILNH